MKIIIAFLIIIYIYQMHFLHTHIYLKHLNLLHSEAHKIYSFSHTYNMIK